MLMCKSTLRFLACLRLALAASLTFLSSLPGYPDSRMARIVAARPAGVI